MMSVSHELSLCCFIIFLQCLSSYAWQQEAVLDDAGLVHFYWTVDVKKNAFLFEIQAKTPGYVGFGISPNATMERADIMVGYVDREGAHLTDYWASQNGKLESEESQDWKLLVGRQNDSHTMLRVRRKINPADNLDAAIPNVLTWVIWAMHPDDPAPGKMPAYHGERRGATQLCIIVPNCFASAGKPDHRTYFSGGSSSWSFEPTTLHITHTTLISLILALVFVVAPVWGA